MFPYSRAGKLCKSGLTSIQMDATLNMSCLDLTKMLEIGYSDGCQQSDEVHMSPCHDQILGMQIMHPRLLMCLGTLGWVRYFLFIKNQSQNGISL